MHIVSDIQRHRTRRTLPVSHGTYTSYLNKDGDRKVDGGPNLTVTENYPADFGAAVATVYEKHAEVLRNAAAAHIASCPPINVGELLLTRPDNLWDGAQLVPVLRQLSSMCPGIPTWLSDSD